MRGIGTYVRGMADALRRQHEVPIEFWGWSDDRPFEPEPPHRAWWLPRGPVPRTKYPTLLQGAMRLRIRLTAAGAVHITDPNALVASAARPVLTTVYDLIPMHEAASAGNPAYVRYLERLKASRVLFAISQATADDVLESLGVDRTRIRLARPGVVLPDLDAAIAPSRGPFFLYVGSPDHHKNLDTLIRAMSMCSALPERLVLSGSWPPDRLGDLLARVGADQGLRSRVEHLGFVERPHLLGLMRACTAVVVPSLVEGFGLPVAEAMAAGAAVAHSKLPVLEEVSAGCALTFDPKSAGELADCLRRLSADNDLRQKLRDCGRRRAETLTWDAALQTTLAAYRETLAPGQTGDSR